MNTVPLFAKLFSIVLYYKGTKESELNANSKERSLNSSLRRTLSVFYTISITDYGYNN